VKINRSRIILASSDSNQQLANLLVLRASEVVVGLNSFNFFNSNSLKEFKKEKKLYFILFSNLVL
jgi:hypothetical protein